PSASGSESLPSATASLPEDRLAFQVRALRSGDPKSVREVLKQPHLDPAAAGHLVPLLAWDEVCEQAIRALRPLAPRVVGMLVDSLLDPDQEFAVRRRVPRVIATVASPRAVSGLMLGLEDKRFEVRYQCGRGLALLHRRHPDLPIARSEVLAAILRELRVDRPIWESRRLLDQGMEDPEDPDALVVGRLLRDRANKSLEHVFTLLALILETEPLRVAFQGLHTEDPILRGTALEYLESVLPVEVREKLWPFLELDRHRPSAAPRPHREVLDQLMRSHESIAIQLRRRETTDSDSSSDRP
ncbi:MAG: hypothetical protein KC729_18210, partial [Candidatus Eisenbacteria bacterium]|nr:hypothetical protein [Candidatus Eisenbacteria bacterium]